jgi:hypothetical protein
MNANELRIGNWVKLFDSDKPYKIHVVSKKVIQVGGDLLGGDLFNIKNVFPIELTPEILEKAGFKISAYEQYRLYLSIGYIWHNGKTGGHSLDIDNLDYDTHITSINYLHQLQNFYYIHEGQELEIEL